jgi:oligopeptide transport system substrate-binding protein
VASDDLKIWTFHLRTNAVWSNGDPVTAADFVRSWRRLGEIGDKIAHPDLLTNIVGFPFAAKRPDVPASDLLPKPGERDVIGVAPPSPGNPDKQISNSNTSTLPQGPAPAEFGVSALDGHTLQVMLITADKDFPRLVAHPSFRPVFGDANELAGNTIASTIVGNGAFNVASADAYAGSGRPQG